VFAIRSGTVGLAVVALVGGCERATPEPPAEAPPKKVEVTDVHPSDLPVEFEFVGRTVSSHQVEIRARVSGFLDEIAYEEGEFVDEGDPMFRIDPAPFEARLRAAQAELAQEEARLQNAEALLARVQPLAEADAVARKELDDATGRVRAASAAVEGASARVFDAQLNLDYATISAPLRGLTSSASQREGAYISESTGALTYIARIDPIWVEFSISETQILRSQQAREEGVLAYPEDGSFDVTITLADGSTYPETGRISFTDASISTSTGTFLVRAEIPNPEDALRPGQYVRVSLGGAFRPDAISLPKRAVHQGPRSAFVWVVDSNRNAEQRPVRLGPWIGDRWVVERGLRVGDRVVVNGAVGLMPGARLSVAPAGSSGPRLEQPDAGDGP
jgi:membrane fusion protein (multidrug efflux system)